MEKIYTGVDALSRKYSKHTVFRHVVAPVVPMPVPPAADDGYGVRQLD